MANVPEHWQTVPFPDVVYFQEGPGIRNWQYRDAGIPFVNIRCLVDGRLVRSAMNCLDPDEVDKKYRHFLLDEDDYVVSSSGTIGRLAEVRREDLPCMLNTSVIRMRPLSDELDRRYLRYFLTSSHFQDQIVAFASGSVQVNYGPSHLKQMWIAFPPMPEQRAIAEVLGALDDKIEANRRAQDNAESLARAELALAQQEEAEFDVPIGRLVERIAHIVQPTDLDESTVYVGLEHMPRGSMLLKERGRANGLASAKAAFRPKDVLFGKLRPYFKKVVVAPSTGVCSTDILVLRPLLGDWAVATAVCASDDVIEYASAGSEGTRMPRVSWEYLARYEVPLPGPQGRQRLEARIAPLLEFGVGLTVESDSLIDLRDALLPNLMSGELRVRDAEHLIEDAV